MANLWRVDGAPTRWIIASLVALCVAGCGGEGDGDGGEAARFEAVTYNAGLAENLVDLTPQRLQPVADALAETDADVVCLQEVWPRRVESEFESVRAEAIIEAASEQYPFHYLPELPNPDVSTRCSTETLGAILSCLQQNCADAADPFDCAFERCEGVLMSTDRECRRCIGSSFDLPVQEIAARCRDGEGEFFAFGGQPGVVVLSRHEILEREFHVLPGGAVQHAVLRVRVDLPDLGAAEAYCTHLTAESLYEVFPVEGTASFEEFQGEQVEAMLQWVGRTESTRRTLLLGDMNTGPAKGELTGEFPANYARFPDRGWSVPYVDRQPNPACTFCQSNTLVGETDDNVIDHVVLRFSGGAAFRVAGVERILDRTRPVSLDGGSVETHLSDHFGVRVVLRAK